MIMIDSQIWIYYLDPLALENPNVEKWFEGDNPHLISDEIAMSSIIPLEIAHSIYKNPKINRDIAEQTLHSLIALKNNHFIDLDKILMLKSLDILKQKSNLGIGGRDAIIVASMVLSQINELVTHDKGMLKLQEFRRIDIVFNPPLIFEVNEKFDEVLFQQRLLELDRKN